MDWTQLLQAYGFPAAIVVALGYFFWAKVWPDLVLSFRDQHLQVQMHLVAVNQQQADTNAKLVAIQASQAEDLSTIRSHLEVPAIAGRIGPRDGQPA